jgi:hypothetical protein
MVTSAPKIPPTLAASIMIMMKIERFIPNPVESSDVKVNVSFQEKVETTVVIVANFL